MAVWRLFLTIVALFLSYNGFSLRIGGFGVRRISRLHARIDKTPGVEVPAHLFRATTVPTPSGSIELDKNRPKRNFNVATVNPSDPFTFGYVHIGKIIGAHGVCGEVKIQTEIDANPNLSSGTIVYIKKPTRRTPRPVRVARSRRQGTNQTDIHLVLFDDVRTRTVADMFAKYEVYTRPGKTPHKPSCSTMSI